MKAYTDLNQSKKLAEILPIESADMIYMPMMDIDSMSNSGFFDIPECYSFNEFKDSDTKPLPCWSLAALLEQLPEIINYEDDESDYALEISKENDLYYLSYGNPFEHGKLEVEPQENFVDTCYEMIIKLHEQKLL